MHALLVLALGAHFLIGKVDNAIALLLAPVRCAVLLSANLLQPWQQGRLDGSVLVVGHFADFVASLVSNTSSGRILTALQNQSGIHSCPHIIRS